MEPLLLSQMSTSLILFLGAIICGHLPYLIAKDYFSSIFCWANNSKKPSSGQQGSKVSGSRRVAKNGDHEAGKVSTATSADYEEIGGQSTLELTNRLVGRAKVLSALTCFGGGALFATCFLHLIPEVKESLTSSSSSSPAVLKNDSPPTGHSDTSSTHSEPFPMAELLICLGFFMIYFVEEAAHAFYHNWKKGSHVHFRVKQVKGARNQGAQRSTLSPEGDFDIEEDDKCIKDGCRRKILLTGGQEGCTLTDYGSTARTTILDGHGKCTRADDLSGSTINLIESASNCDVTNINDLPLINAIVIIIALSVHSIFEGMAIGVQGSPSHVWQLGLSIGIHKFIIAFVVGIELFTTVPINTVSTHFKNVLLLTLFSLMTPLGILLAALASFHVDEGETVVGILTALATGSLLYVTFFEILQKERQSRKISGFSQLLSMSAGFLLMAAIQYSDSE